MSEALRGRLRRVTPGQLLVAAAFVVILCVLVRRGGDPDIFWHLVTGQWMVDHHQVVSHDLFTFTVAGKQWIDPEYTTEIIAYLVYKVGGLALVSLAFGAVSFVGFLLIWRRVQLEASNKVIAAIAIGIAALGGVLVWGPRPQMITFTLSCLELLWLDRYLRGKSRAIYWLPLVMIAWANLHGGFLFGLVPVGVAAFVEAVHWVRRVDGDVHKRRTRNLVLVFVACVVAAVDQPQRHPSLRLRDPATVLGHSAELHRRMAVAQLPRPLGTRLRADAAAHSGRVRSAAPIVVGGVPDRGGDVPGALRGAPLRTVRGGGNALAHMVVLGRLGAPRAGRAGAHVDGPARQGHAGRRGRGPCRRDRRHRVFRALDAVQSIASDGGELPGRRVRLARGASERGHPHVQSVRLGRIPHLPLLSEANRRVFSFGEATLLGNKVMQQVSDVETGNPDWQQIFAEWNIDYVIDVPGAPAVLALEVDPQWTKVYDDGLAVIMVKNSALARTGSRGRAGTDRRDRALEDALRD